MSEITAQPVEESVSTKKVLHEATYKCTNTNCNAEQVISDFPDVALPPFTCCTTCKAGFGKEPAVMAAMRIGMFPTTAPRMIEV